MPTEKQIQEAKLFLQTRIEAEISAKNNIEEYMMEAAREIIAISQKYNIPPRLFRFGFNESLRKEVDNVIKTLKENIIYATETLSVYDREDDKDSILIYINSDKYGKTFKERVNEYANRYKFELEAAIAAGIFFGKTDKEILSTIKKSLSMPYNNQYIKGSFDKGLSATRIETKGISYGVGKSSSAYNLLTSLSRNEIALTWMWWYGKQALKKNATGFYSFRGSSYPCALCDDMVGFHPMQDYRYQWHLNCRCYFVFV